MNPNVETEITEAVKNSDGQALESAVRKIPAGCRDYEEIESIVLKTNRQYVQKGSIELGGTVIRNVFGGADLRRA